MTVKDLRKYIKENSIAKNYQYHKKSKLIDLIMGSRNNGSQNKNKPSRKKPEGFKYEPDEDFSDITDDERERELKNEIQYLLSEVNKKKNNNKNVSKVKKITTKKNKQIIPAIQLPQTTPVIPAITITNNSDMIKKEIDMIKEEIKLLKEHNKKIKQPNTEKNVTYKDSDKKQIDAGHTIVNVYCNGSNHPDFPIPQSVVRHALNANALPQAQQQQVGEQVQQIAQTMPVIRGIPPEAITAPVPHPSHKKVKKFPPVETTKPIKKIQPTQISEKAQKAKDKVAEELKQIKKTSGFNADFKSKLESILGGR